MKPGTRQHGTASLRLSHNTSVPAHLRGGLLEVSHVCTPEADRGKGLASMLLQKVCAEADEAGKLLLIHPKSYDDSPMDAEQLTDWYVMFGFEVLQETPVRLLVRKVGAERLVSVKPLALAMGMM